MYRFLAVLLMVFVAMIFLVERRPEARAEGVKEVQAASGEQKVAEPAESGQGTTETQEESEEEAPTVEEEVGVQDLGLSLHKGLKTWPVRKLIVMIITRAEKRGITRIDGVGKSADGNHWALELNTTGKSAKTYQWEYLRDKWDISPMNEAARETKFPLSDYVVGPAVDVALGAVEPRGGARVVEGSMSKNQSEGWDLKVKVTSANNEIFIQKWQYAKKGKKFEFVPVELSGAP